MDQTIRDLLHDAERWHLMSRLLERPCAGWHARLRTLGAAPALNTDADADLREAASLADSATEGRYLASFGPSGVVSPREAAHCGMRDPGQLLAELEARYGAFGFRPATEDPVDHVAVEVDFVGYLRLKEALAQSEGDADRAALTAEAADAFIADHLRDVAAPIAERLETAAQPYLARAARALATRVGPPQTAPSRKVIWLDDESLTCGETGASSEETLPDA
ncbi:MAG TPA: molecular chaperone TorD family protein [Vicinamibacterales bacterium]|nr:molecular chaperone TorD family protein [Vicinamibacterales bacterium]